jgi:hypothetical protein
MKLFLAATALLVTGTCFAGATTHHWLAKVPVKPKPAHAKKVKGFNYKAKAYNGKNRQTKGKVQAVLTRVLGK